MRHNFWPLEHPNNRSSPEWSETQVALLWLRDEVLRRRKDCTPLLSTRLQLKPLAQAPTMGAGGHPDPSRSTMICTGRS